MAVEGIEASLPGRWGALQGSGEHYSSEAQEYKEPEL